MSSTIIQMTDIHAGYGGMNILHGIEFSLMAGQIGVIVGPNGAGKSTTLKALFGLLHCSQGSIEFDGQDITNKSPELLAELGMAFVPQENNVFQTLTVHENLEMGAYIRRDSFTHMLDQVYGIFPALQEKRNQQAGELSGGQRQMVAIGRALMIEPKFLMLDEPTAGLSPMFMSEVFNHIIAVNKTGVTVAMVEQNAKQALGFADKGYVLASGRNRFTDTGQALLDDPEVAKSFLGG